MMQSLSHLAPDYVADRLAAVEDVRRAWVVVVAIAALVVAMSFVQ
jgi:hypothetical protein